MLWVIRAGKKDRYIEKFISDNKIYMPWDGFAEPLTECRNREDYRKLVAVEMQVTNTTSISNWSGQLYSFVHDLKIGDYIVVPVSISKTYCLGIITGEYSFDKDNTLHHCRTVKFIEKEIPKDIFSQKIKYSLAAYRTLFKLRDEEEFNICVKEWKEGKANETTI